MAQELGGWSSAIVSAVSGGIAALVAIGTFLFRAGRRDEEVNRRAVETRSEIDRELADFSNELRDQIHAQRLYVDEQDRKNRHEIVAVIQQQASKTDALLDKINGKLEYHEEHDDKRFSQLTDRISDGFKELSQSIADLRVQLATQQAWDLRESGRPQVSRGGPKQG